MKGLRKGELATCHQCGKQFLPDSAYYYRNRKSPKYCSPACWYAYQRQHLGTRLCAQCMTPFKGIGATRKFCSRKCLLLSRGSFKTCRMCGIEYQAPPTQRNSYCSRKCYQAWRESKNPIKPCLQCGVLFRRHKGGIHQTKAKYCSRNCMFLYIRAHGSQLRQVRFYSRCQDRGPDWKESATEARRRFDHKCAAIGCGMSGPKRADVDHLIPYRLLLKLLETNPLINPNDQRNLMPLCKCHHMQKTAIETRLFRGDVIGFLQEAKRLIPVELLQEALTLYGLTT